MRSKRLKELEWYYGFTRQAGHTTFMIDGINFDRESVILFVNNSHAQDNFRRTVERYQLKREQFDLMGMKIGKVRFATIGWLNNLQDNIRGRSIDSMPVVVVDHFAMQVLIDEYEEYIRDSEQNQIFAILRHLKIKHNSKEIMAVRKDWHQIAGMNIRVDRALKDGEWRFE